PGEKIELTEVTNMYERLNKQKPIRWQKDLKFLLATSYYVSEKVADNQIIETNIFTTLEYLHQIQQAIIVASMMVATTTISNSSNNSVDEISYHHILNIFPNPPCATK